MIKVTIGVDNDLDVAGVIATLKDRAPLHAKIASDAERFIRTVGPYIAARNHRTADTLGARRTGHLEDVFAAVEGQSSDQDAILLVPRASRLRAAFGAYTVKPMNGRKYLTIPVHKDAHGRRAGELEDLFFMRTGPRGTAVLARRVEGKKDESLRTRPGQRRRARRYTTAEILFILVTEADIPEQPNLFPFEELKQEALSSAEEFIDEVISQ